MTPSPWPARAAITLLVLAVIALAAGHLILVHDPSGYGHPDESPRMGVLAVVLLLGAGVVGATDSAARRALGRAVGILAGTLLVLRLTLDDWRFVWASDEAELLLLTLALGGAAAALLVLPEPGGTPAPGARAATSSGTAAASAPASYGGVLLVAGLVVLPVVAFYLGSAHFSAVNCSGPDFGGECDLAPFEGMLWSAGALVAVLATALVVRLRRRRP